MLKRNWILLLVTRILRRECVCADCCTSAAIQSPCVDPGTWMWTCIHLWYAEVFYILVGSGVQRHMCVRVRVKPNVLNSPPRSPAPTLLLEFWFIFFRPSVLKLRVCPKRSVYLPRRGRCQLCEERGLYVTTVVSRYCLQIWLRVLSSGFASGSARRSLRIVIREKHNSRIISMLESNQASFRMAHQAEATRSLSEVQSVQYYMVRIYRTIYKILY